MVKKYLRKEHMLLIGFSTFIFLSMLLFFLKIHPLIIYDAICIVFQITHPNME